MRKYSSSSRSRETVKAAPSFFLSRLESIGRGHRPGTTTCRRGLVAGLAAILGCATVPADAGTIRYRIDPSYTSIAFDVDNLGGLFATHGLFGKFHGVLALDFATPENSRVDVTADTASIATGSSVVDDTLRSSDYFNPPRFPTIRYVADRVDRAGPDRFLLHGHLTIRGITLPQTFTARLEGRGDRPGQGPVANFVVDGTINRDDYGMTADPLMVSSTVAVTIRAHILLTPRTAAAGALETLTPP
jgi:polyisoprenoid-binding protein YceI